MQTILFLLSALVIIWSAGRIGYRRGRRKSSYETLIFQQLQTLNMKTADLVTGLQGLTTKVNGIGSKISGADVDPSIVSAFNDLSTAVNSVDALVPDPAASTPAADATQTQATS